MTAPRTMAQSLREMIVEKERKLSLALTSGGRFNPNPNSSNKRTVAKLNDHLRALRGAAGIHHTDRGQS